MVLINGENAKIINGRQNKMCKICKALCDNIEALFGHRVDPVKLAELIESSPIPNKEDYERQEEQRLAELSSESATGDTD